MEKYSQPWNMVMISGIMDTTQHKNITRPQNYLKSPSTNMQQRRFRIPIYTNCKGGDVDLRGVDDGVEEGDEDTSPTPRKSWWR
jgi:hypothetical protein